MMGFNVKQVKITVYIKEVRAKSRYQNTVFLPGSISKHPEHPNNHIVMFFNSSHFVKLEKDRNGISGERTEWERLITMGCRDIDSLMISLRV